MECGETPLQPPLGMDSGKREQGACRGMPQPQNLAGMPSQVSTHGVPFDPSCVSLSVGSRLQLNWSLASCR